MLASEILRMVLGLAAVIGMIGLAALAVRKAGLASFTGIAGKKRRLSLSEMLPLDARRRLALIRCDDREYLVVLGPSGETLIARDLEAIEPEIEAGQPTGQNPFAEWSALGSRLRKMANAPAEKDAA